MNLSTFKIVVEVNLIGTWLCAKEAAIVMQKQEPFNADGEHVYIDFISQQADMLRQSIQGNVASS